jgi:tRNA pseudouridine65 synthase
MKQLRVIYQDTDLVVVDKPAGFQVHAPEGRPEAGNIVLKILRNQLGQWVFPVHRLDRATSGVLVFALSPEVAGLVQKQFKAGEMGKTYLALVRGWLPDAGVIDSPLTRRLDGGTEVPACTDYETLFRFERDHPLGKHASVRYSLLKVTLHTGRLHQIRRHFKRISHPLIGDTVHGDGKHNQLWREWCPNSGLFLKAYRFEMKHPKTGVPLTFYSKWNTQWHRLFDLCGYCPFIR